MRVSRLAAAAVSCGLVLTALVAPVAAQAVPPGKCDVPVISKSFDRDQTGGWWAVTIDMRCNHKYTKEFVVNVQNRRTGEVYFFQALPTTNNRYYKVVTVPAAPPTARESACADASAATYGPNENPLDSQRTKDCFPIAPPA